MVRRVARRRDRFQAEPATLDDLAIDEAAVGEEGCITAGIEPRCVADNERPRRAVRSFGEHGCAGRRLDEWRRRRMVAVRVRHENVRDGFAAHRVEQCRNMPLIGGPRIDDRHLPGTDDVADRAFESEGAGIVGENAPHSGSYLVNGSRIEVELSVERNVVGHKRIVVARH